MDTRILVIGAGISGLTAACELAETGCAVTVLEASERIGGRILSEKVDGISVELGAEFVHGKPPELLRAIENCALLITERDGDAMFYGRDGALLAEEGQKQNGTIEEDGIGTQRENDPSDVLERMKEWSARHPERDLSFGAWAAEQHLTPDVLQNAYGYVEGFNAADADVISVRSLALQQQAEDDIEGQRLFAVNGGYTQLAEGLAELLRRQGGIVRLRQHVTAVVWKQNEVTVQLAGGESVIGGAAVISLPLGVLQGNAVRFQPRPGNVLEHAARMRMGHVCRMNLVFRKRWWAEMGKFRQKRFEKLSFLLPKEREANAEGPHFGVFFTPFPSLDPVITAWSGGPTADAFASLDDHAIAHIACSELAGIFGLSREEVLQDLRSHHRHDWGRDPLAMGAYSWVPAGATDASRLMSEPVENTLFFAGEHTDVTGHWGTVHGAMRSGKRAARQVLEQMADSRPLSRK